MCRHSQLALSLILTSLLASASCDREREGEPATGTATAALINEGNVVTQHNNPQRTGAQLNETILTPANVNLDNFGPLYTRNVDGNIYAQPLYVNGVGGDPAKRWVFVATMNNKVYAFDAANENGNPATAPVWVREIAPPVPHTAFFPSPNNNFLDGSNKVGILATPVIVPETNTMYVFGTDNNTTPHTWKLFALDIRDGTFKYGTQKGVVATGTVQGPKGANGAIGPITFDSRRHLSRPGLLILGTGATTRIYAGFGSFQDEVPFHGWVYKFIDNQCTPAATCNGLSLSAFHMTTPFEQTGPTWPGIDGGGGLWMSGNGIAGNPATLQLYISTGNGSYSRHGDAGPTEPLLPNSTESQMVVLDALTMGVLKKWFPPNFGPLNRQDTDFGSAGVLVLPGPDGGRLLTGSKTGVLYAFKPDLASSVVGKTGPTQAWQAFENTQEPQAVVPDMPCTVGVPTVMCPVRYDAIQPGPGFGGKFAPNLHGTPVYFDGGTFKRVYAWSEKDHIKGWDYDKAGSPGMFDLVAKVPAAMGDRVSNLRGMPGAALSISANGTQNGIVWATVPETNPNRCGQDAVIPNIYCDASVRRKPGRLYAYNAATMAKLWDGYVPGHAKFAIPTVAAGRVYVPTFSGRLVVFGISNQTVATWRTLSGGNILPMGSLPAVTSWGGARLDVFVRAKDPMTMNMDSLKHRAWLGDGSGQWLPAAWEPHGGILFGGPAVTSWGPNRLDILVRDNTNNLQTRQWNGGWVPPVGYTPLPPLMMGGEPTIVTWGPDRADAFVVDSQQRMAHAALVNGVWSPWEIHDGNLLKAGSRLAVVVTTDRNDVPGVLRWTSGISLHVFARLDNADGNLLYKRWNPFQWQPGINAAWTNLGGATLGDPAAVTRADGKLDVFVQNLDGELSRRWSDNGGVTWFDWDDRVPAPGAPNPGFPWLVLAKGERPLILSSGDGSMTLYARGGDNVVHRCLFNGQYWTLWQKLRGGSSLTAPVGVRTTAGDQLILTTFADILHAEPPAAAPP